VSAALAGTPPRLARALLRSLLPGDARDEIDGDLHELFLKRRTERGRAVAAVWYWGAALSFIMRFTADRLARALRSSPGGASSGQSPTSAHFGRSIAISFPNRVRVIRSRSPR
jgi:hypothetical protein